MCRKLLNYSIFLIVLSFLLLGCNSTEPITSYTQDLSTDLPDINSFSSTCYEQTEYVFPPIKSAEFIHDGITEKLSKDDPRLFRLLNALSYSYDKRYTAWRQGFVEEEEFLSYVNSGYPMLDVHFCLDDAPPFNTEFAHTPRIIISANRYLLLADTTESSWMPDGRIYANEHFPFSVLLIERNEPLSDEESGELMGDIAWGNDKWIDLLEYGGFYSE